MKIASCLVCYIALFSLLAQDLFLKIMSAIWWICALSLHMLTLMKSAQVYAGKFTTNKNIDLSTQVNILAYRPPVRVIIAN